MSDVPAEIEPAFAELVDWHTRMRVATKLLMDLHSPMLFTSFRSRYRVKRPDKFQTLGKRLSELTLEVVRLQDELGEIVNATEDEVFGVEEEAQTEGT